MRISFLKMNGWKCLILKNAADSGGLHGGDLCRWLYSGGGSKGISV